MKLGPGNCGMYVACQWLGGARYIYTYLASNVCLGSCPTCWSVPAPGPSTPGCPSTTSPAVVENDIEFILFETL